MTENMKEIGGYIELDSYSLPMLHEDAVALNCGRNCLAYLIRAKGIKKIALPYFLCGTIRTLCIKAGIKIRYYHLDTDLTPMKPELETEEWLYIVNYYGQLDNFKLKKLSEKYGRVIVDNAQAYFQTPVKGIDTLYTCRKFLGVADGAFLFTDTLLDEEIPLDESYKRMNFLLGRYERTASEFYSEYVDNNQFFSNEPVKRMSLLTKNLLHGIDYDAVRKRRTENFAYLHKAFQQINQLDLSVPEGSFMYPLYLDNGTEIRRKLLEDKIYIPVLWPDVSDICARQWKECDMAENILPLPVDQRYGEKEMELMIQKIRAYMR